jgi:phosphoserine aminotransferase
VLFFTPGPSQLYPTVKEHINTALDLDITSISHRSDHYKEIHKATVDGLDELLNLNNQYTVFFGGSATEMMERVLQIRLAKHSVHLVNGAFSKRFYQFARAENLDTTVLSKKDGNGFDMPMDEFPEHADVLCLTHNETSTGVVTPLSFIESVKLKSPKLKIILDVVSSIPVIPFNEAAVDCAFFSVQKGFGLPSGLGVLLMKNTFLREVLSVGDLGYGERYHSISSWYKYGCKYQTPETPNVFGIYLLGKIIQDMLAVGIDKIRTDTIHKFNLIKKMVQAHPDLSMFVSLEKFQSPSVSAINVRGGSQRIVSKLMTKGMQIGFGYGRYKMDQIRIANFAAHSIKDIKTLCDAINNEQF